MTSSGVSPPSSVNLVTGLLTMAVCLAGCSASSSGPTSSSAASGTTPASRSGSSPAASPGWIVYQSNDGLALVRQDGSGGHPLLVDQSIAWNHPDWSPDGKTLAVVREDEDKTTDIWRIDRDGSTARRLVDCQAPCEYAENPAWSPDGTRIAYWTQGPTSTTQDIRVVDADSGKVVLAVTAPEYQAPVNPRWSPEGTQIAVNVEHFLPGAENPDGSAMGVIDLQTTRPTIRLLTAFTLQASYPAWSPDGSHLAFMAGNLDPVAHPEQGPSDLLAMRPDGSGLTRLTHQRAGQALIVGPDWAADDLILVTLVRSPDDYNLATIHADGTGLTDLVDPKTGVADRGGAHPRWSPVAT